MQNSETGKLGEEIAAQYLCGKHYLILIRNHREKFDEIDIIARHSDGTLIFCEVKTINGTHERYSDFFMPEDHLDQRKIKKLIRSSSIFLAKYPMLINEERGWQIDVITIVLHDGKAVDLHHYENL